MDWAGIDALLWLALCLALIFFGAKALFAFLNAKGLISDDFNHGIQSFIP